MGVNDHFKPSGELLLAPPASQNTGRHGAMADAETNQKESSIPKRLRSLAHRFGERRALTFQTDDTLTFGQLDKQVNALMEALNHRGIGRDDRVALALPDGPNMAVAVVGGGCWGEYGAPHSGVAGGGFLFIL